MDSGVLDEEEEEGEEEEVERDPFRLVEKAWTVVVVVFVQREGKPTTRIVTTINQRPPRVACPIMIWVEVNQFFPGGQGLENHDRKKRGGCPMWVMAAMLICLLFRGFRVLEWVQFAHRWMCHYADVEGACRPSFNCPARFVPWAFPMFYHDIPYKPMDSESYMYV